MFLKHSSTTYGRIFIEVQWVQQLGERMPTTQYFRVSKWPHTMCEIMCMFTCYTYDAVRRPACSIYVALTEPSIPMNNFGVSRTTSEWPLGRQATCTARTYTHIRVYSCSVEIPPYILSLKIFTQKDSPLRIGKYAFTVDWIFVPVSNHLSFFIHRLTVNPIEATTSTIYVLAIITWIKCEKKYYSFSLN